MSDWTSEHAQMIEDCEARESRMTEWASGFIDSLKDHLSRGRDLTDKQAAKPNEIWERVTAEG